MSKSHRAFGATRIFHRCLIFNGQIKSIKIYFRSRALIPADVKDQFDKMTIVPRFHRAVTLVQVARDALNAK